MDGATISVVATLVLCLVGNALHKRFRRDTRVKRALAHSERVSVHDARDGRVCLNGRVRARGEILRAPVSGRACVAYQLFVENSGIGGEFSLEVQQARPFEVVDDSGVALVDTSGPLALALVRDVKGTTRGEKHPGAHAALAEVLWSRGCATADRRGRWRPFQYYEGALVEGALVSVAGSSAHEVALDGDRPSPREPPLAPVLHGTTDQPLLVSNAREALADK